MTRPTLPRMLDRWQAALRRQRCVRDDDPAARARWAVPALPDHGRAAQGRRRPGAAVVRHQHRCLGAARGRGRPAPDRGAAAAGDARRQHRHLGMGRRAATASPGRTRCTGCTNSRPAASAATRADFAALVHPEDRERLWQQIGAAIREHAGLLGRVPHPAAGRAQQVAVDLGRRAPGQRRHGGPPGRRGDQHRRAQAGRGGAARERSAQGRLPGHAGARTAQPAVGHQHRVAGAAARPRTGASRSAARAR